MQINVPGYVKTFVLVFLYMQLDVSQQL